MNRVRLVVTRFPSRIPHADNNRVPVIEISPNDPPAYLAHYAIIDVRYQNHEASMSQELLDAIHAGLKRGRSV